jgi:hypothetical protein
MTLRRLAGWRPLAFIFRPVFSWVVASGLSALKVDPEEVAVVLVEDISLLEPALQYFSAGWVVFDSRENHAATMAESLTWRLFRLPEIRRISKKFYPLVDRLITVSPQIQGWLASNFSREVSLIPNVPNYAPRLPLESTGELRIVFHGQVNSSRGIIQSTVAIAESNSAEFHIYPSGRTKDLRKIKEVASRYPRVFIHQLVSPAEIPLMLMGYDVGFASYPPTNSNLQAAMPNKFFEYVFAGLPPIVQTGSTMARYVDRWGFGFVVDVTSEGSLRRLIRSLTRDQISEQRELLPSIWEELSEENQRTSFLSAVIPPEFRSQGL